MSMTISEKVLARAGSREKVSPGEMITCKIDVICIDELQFPFFKRTLEKMGTDLVDRNRLVLVVDHYSPPTNLEQAKAIHSLRQFARSKRLSPVEGGIKHQTLMENGFVRPGMVLVGTDSHMNTCGALGAFATAVGPAEAAMMAVTGESWFMVPETIRYEINGELKSFVTPKDIALYILGEKGLGTANYKAIEYVGQTVRGLSVDGRIVLCNVSTEMGAKTGLVECDSVTETFLKANGVGNFTGIRSDSDASYAETISIDISSLEPLVALPHSPANVALASKAAGTKIDQAFVGSCVGGNIEDLRLAAKILKNHVIHPYTRLIITPASRKIHLEALSEGLIDIFLKAKAIVSGSTCSVCGAFEGCLASGEVCISTSPRNFLGRMGSPEALVYLGSPATVAASSIKGEITDPREFL
jgi:3-isopropylmalate/(R)-2-methylmalate dehydratase large subunit